MRKNVLLLVLVVLVLGGLWANQHFAPSTTPSATMAQAAPVPVTAVPVARHDMPITLQGLGNVSPYNQVTVRPQVDGQLKQVLFKEGQQVRAGDLLAQIDPRSYQAQLDQAVAKKAQDQAALVNARTDAERYSALVEKQYIARQQLDTARAQVAQLAAAVQGDEAAIENAQVQLGYTTIRSPIDGRTGIRQIDIGNIVHASDPTGIVVITQTRPISVLFTLPEDSVTPILKAMNAGPLKVAALSRDGKQQLDEGKLELIDSQIDATTGTVRLKATLPNTAGLLWPGQFVNAQLLVDIRRQVLTIPIMAVQRGQQGTYTYVVKEDGSVENRTITLGPIAEGQAVVESGLAEGERVVTTGQYRLQPGSRVTLAKAE